MKLLRDFFEPYTCLIEEKGSRKIGGPLLLAVIRVKKLGLWPRGRSTVQKMRSTYLEDLTLVSREMAGRWLPDKFRGGDRFRDVPTIEGPSNRLSFHSHAATLMAGARSR